MLDLYNRLIDIQLMGSCEKQIAEMNKLKLICSSDCCSDSNPDFNLFKVLTMLIDAYLCCANDDFDESLILYDSIHDHLGKIKNDSPLLYRIAYAEAEFGKALVWDITWNVDAADQKYADLISWLDFMPELQFKKILLRTIYRRGVNKFQINECEFAVSIFDDLLNRFDFSDKYAILFIAQAMLQRGFSLAGLGDYKESVKQHDILIQKIASYDDIRYIRLTAYSLSNKGSSLAKLNMLTESIMTYDKLLDEFGSFCDLEVQVQVVWTYYEKGLCLDKLGRLEEAVSVYTDLIARFESSDDSLILELVEKAQLNKKLDLDRLANGEE